MTHEELQAILSAMMQSGAGVSDCLFLHGKPPLVERYGTLQELPMEGPDATLQSAHLDAMANLLLDDSPRLRSDLTETGSCDTSYALPGVARFRVNIYRQNGHTGIVMRKLAVPGAVNRVARLAAHFQRDGEGEDTGSSSSPAAPAAARQRLWRRC